VCVLGGGGGAPCMGLMGLVVGEAQ
jgi:hypothetical protein